MGNRSIASLELHDCYGRYTDATTVEPFERKIESVNGTINQIATDSIRAYLVDQAGVDASRVTVLPETAQAEDSGDRVSCKLSVT